MYQAQTTFLLTWAGLLTVCPGWALSADPSIEAVGAWHSVLPNSTVQPEYRVSGDDLARLAWELKARRRVVSRGGQPIRADGAKGPIKIKLAIPALEDEVSLDVELHAQLEDADGKALGEPHVKRLWILSPDPFAEKRAWLETLGVVLFDPGKNTIEPFEKARIPFRVMRGLDALAATEKGLVIVGERTSLESQGPLAETLWQLASKGRDVLVLAPKHGTVIPFAQDGKRRADKLRSLSLRRRDIITQLDKRLDAEAWLSFKVPRGGLVAKLHEVLETLVGNGIAHERKAPWGMQVLQ